MIVYLSLSLLLFLVLLAVGSLRGQRRLETLSRLRRAQLAPAGRALHEAECRALSQAFGLAFTPSLPLCQIEGMVRLIGWRRPMFVLDEVLVGLPDNLLPCASSGWRAELVLNPHGGLPHAFVVSLNGNSLLCECEARQAGIELPPAPAAQPGEPFREALPQVQPALR